MICECCSHYVVLPWMCMGPTRLHFWTTFVIFKWPPKCLPKWQMNADNAVILHLLKAHSKHHLSSHQHWRIYNKNLVCYWTKRKLCSILWCSQKDPQICSDPMCSGRVELDLKEAFKSLQVTLDPTLSLKSTSNSLKTQSNLINKTLSKLDHHGYQFC